MLPAKVWVERLTATICVGDKSEPARVPVERLTSGKVPMLPIGSVPVTPEDRLTKAFTRFPLASDCTGPIVVRLRAVKLPPERLYVTNVPFGEISVTLDPKVCGAVQP